MQRIKLTTHPQMRGANKLAGLFFGSLSNMVIALGVMQVVMSEPMIAMPCKAFTWADPFT